jgi:hypothetical protein
MFEEPKRIVPEGKVHMIVHVHSGANGMTIPTWPTTVKQIERHTDLYGSELTETVAVSQPAKTRATTLDVRAEVLKLHAEGVLLTSIADGMNLSDRRVREIINAAPG